MYKIKKNSSNLTILPLVTPMLERKINITFSCEGILKSYAMQQRKSRSEDSGRDFFAVLRGLDKFIGIEDGLDEIFHVGISGTGYQ